MFSTKMRGKKAFEAEQKIKEFKNLIWKSKRLYKSTFFWRLKPKKLIQRAVDEMNKIASQKYVFLQEKTLNNERNKRKNIEQWKFLQNLRVS